MNKSRVFQRGSSGLNLLSTLLLFALIGLLAAGFIRLYEHHHDSQVDSNFESLSYNPYFSWLFFSHHTRDLGFSLFTKPIVNTSYEVVAPLFTPHSALLKVTRGDINGSDSFILQYQGNEQGNIFNCQGTPLTANQQTESYYYINEHQDLVCATRNQEASLEKAYPVMKNVEAMVIRLGEDLDNDGLVNRYIVAGSPAITYDKILNMRVSLLLRTNEISESLTPHQYYNLDGEEKGPYLDLYVRKVLTTTVPLKRKTDP
ncbi:MAG: PilW family protein [Candidatus Berkiella sp.]